MAEENLESQTQKRIVLRGIGASRGKCVGVVRIVQNIQDLDQVQFGEVLVTQMTNPNMVLAMRKAAAIVTDFGGMICHAAIISRELGIPCVVGTGSGTKTLKNGMIVEVDGVNGLILNIPQEKKVETSQEGIQKMTGEKGFTIFGHKVKSVSLRMDRDKPMCPEIWDGPWPEVDMTKEYEWIPARPEITGEPIASIVLSGIERIPHTFGFEIDPLFFRFHNATHYLRLDRIRETISLFIDRFESRDRSFFRKYRQDLLESYEVLDEASKEVEKKKYRFGELDSNELLSTLKEWWKIHDKFFSLTYLIQSMGDDIVWPHIRKMLAEALGNETEANEYASILSLPRTETTAFTFFKEAFQLIERSPNKVKSLLVSDLNAKETIEILVEIEGGNDWIEEFKRFIDKWGWVRDRLLYMESLDEEEKMLSFIKSHFARETGFPDPRQAAIKYEECVRKLEDLLSQERMTQLLFYLDIAGFLQKERNDHYFLFLKNTDAIRYLLLELGKRLEDQGLFEDQKDIFFVFARELFDLFSLEIPVEKKQEIVSKIPNRMTAFSYMSKLKLHERKGYDPNGVPKRDGKYY